MRLFAQLACAAALAALSVLAWAPWSLSLAALLAFGALFLCLRSTPHPSAAGLAALAFGLVQHGLGHGWIFDALHEKSGLPLSLALLGTAVFVLYLALFTALPVYAWTRIFRHHASASTQPEILAPAALAALLTLGEWARGLAFNGFTSLSMGYAWLDTPLAGWLPIVGLYGLGFGAYALSFCAALAICSMLRRQIRLAAWLAVGLVAGLAAGHWGGSMPWIEADGERLGFRLIQTGVRQEDKFDRVRMPQNIRTIAERMTEEPADLVLAPETAFPVFFHRLPAGVVDELQRFASKHRAHLFVGVPVERRGREPRNSLLHVAPDSGKLGFYDKELLMPFGEYSLAGFGWFTDRLHLNLADLTPGAPAQAPFVVHGRGAAVLICHEDTIGRLARHRATDSSVLLNPSDLSWFQGSIALPQGLAMVRVRALETGRPILRATGTGTTAHIDHRGNIIGQLPPDEPAVLEGAVQPTRGMTPYGRLGDLPALTACCTVLLAALLRRKRPVLINRVTWIPKPGPGEEGRA